jgi:hypothetical protein
MNSQSTETLGHIAYVLHWLKMNAESKSSYADAILDFWLLDQEEHRFQIHARVFKDMDLENYIAEAVA